MHLVQHQKFPRDIPPPAKATPKSPPKNPQSGIKDQTPETYGEGASPSNHIPNIDKASTPILDQRNSGTAQSKTKTQQKKLPNLQLCLQHQGL